MKFARTPLFRYTVALLGFLFGAWKVVEDTCITDFPIDMVVYREGVKAFLEHRSVYSAPMPAGDIQLPFIYPPFGALAMVPLTAFDAIDHTLAGNIMVILSDLLVLVCLYFVFRAVLKKPEFLLPVTAITWAIVLHFEPVDLNNNYAQINIVVMALVILDLVPRKQFLPQGILIGVAAAIKITPLAMLLYFLVRREWKQIATALFSAVAATLLAAAFRWEAFVEFFSSTLLDMGSGRDFGVGTDYQSNSSIKGAIQRIYPSTESMEANGLTIGLAWIAASLIVIVVVAWLIKRLCAEQLLVDAQLVTALTVLLISPVSWSHHWVWLTLIIPVFAYRAWSWLSTGWAARSLLAVLIAWAALLLTVPPKWWWGDQVDVHAMNHFQKFWVDDFVWLTLVTVALYTAAFFAAQRKQTTRNATPAPLAT
ncbi:glycosyltransferase 87 family protein [Corynebacterium accolens]|uniref:glycosyltransferase 87 family protein n=1 Tax=Corynebacterium accolens TaxID=38284 RepID=UPI0025439020|nr:glycosyltransferase 87 family protein [Corynebacterium accolens]MDK4337069.1 glycosyltransferase 87 family protein [Corynebacterium accolens]